MFLKKKTFLADKIITEFSEKLLQNKGYVKIGVGHYPVNHEALEYMNFNKQDLYHYDLIIVGHYHGGQIRMPFYGALFIPDNIENKSYFPKQKYVSGLNVVGSVNQYISKGLGATGRIILLKFRLFNTPNIDVLTLKIKK